MVFRRLSTLTGLSRRGRMVKSVCVIGAGPSGLSTAKTLIHNTSPGEFKVTLLDASPSIGGLWPLSKADIAKQVHPLMIANQSRHTVQFSDLAWPKDAPQFPMGWQVGKYLQRYHDRYLKDHKDFALRTGARVLKTEKDKDGKWDVEIEEGGKVKGEKFDKLVVATGFFGRPIVPKCIREKDHEIPVIHSSEYRELKDLIGKGRKGGGKKILVVGGQMSGIEIAGTIATHLSSAVNAPGKSEIEDVEEYKIEHIVQRPIWVFPLFSSPEPSAKAAPFLPIDFASYNRSNRPVPLTNSQGHISEEAAKVTHGIYEATFGTDQKEFSKELFIDEETKKQPAYLAVSDWYCEMVRSGMISCTTGKLEGLEGDKAIISGGREADGVAAVVLAAGFDPQPCCEFLGEEVLEKLQYSKQHLDHPLALAFHGTHHPAVPDLGFVGFYRSPYWGVIQMQARFLARLWSHAEHEPEEERIFKEKLEKDVSIERTLNLRNDQRVSQFPMGDYAYLMQELTEALSIPRIDPEGLEESGIKLSHNDKVLDCLTPARFPHPLDDEQAKEEARASVQDTFETSISALTTPRFVARALFRSLLGTWKLERDLTSRLPSHPSGHFSGTAQFLLRKKTSAGLQCLASGATPSEADSPEGLEYLYIENGTFSTSTGFSFPATRRYVYRYDEVKDKMSVWFVKPEDDKMVDYLFHEMEILQPEGVGKEGRGKGWKAKAGHLCVDDYYNVGYEFDFKAVGLRRWGIEYTVNGPKKDYTIKGTYVR